MMWREEGCFLEMFLAYYSQCEANFAPTRRAYRDFLLEILNLHEQTLMKQSFEANYEEARVSCSEPQLPTGFEPQMFWQPNSVEMPEANVGQSNASLIKQETADVEEEETPGQLDNLANADSGLKTEEQESCLSLPAAPSDFLNASEEGPSANPDGAFDPSPEDALPAREKPHKCRVCDKSFTQTWNLRLHERTHTGEKPYECAECARAFADYSSFKRHKLVHTGERPFACPACGKAFASRSNLRAHERTHSGERPHVCPVCQKAFSKRFNLAVHERTHSGEKPFACEQCGMAFINSSNLRSHLRTHSGERPYSCHLCPKSFSHICTLHRHEMTHTAGKQHICSVCSLAFVHRRQLLEHSRSHLPP